MTAMALSSLISSAAELSIDQQLELNRALVQMIKNKRRVAAVVVGSKLLPGQLVTFNAKTRSQKIIKIEKFNRAGTAVVGREHNAKGEQTSTMRWTVPVTLCTVIS
jgi:hypothetical protein